MGTYLRRYGRCEGCKTDLTQPEPLQALEDWKLRVEFTEQPLDIVCCPEDRECSDEQCASGSTPRCCRKCRLPLCHECDADVCGATPRMPAMSLANDLMIFYAPRELYTLNVTVMEMMCASVCLTTMLCYTLEATYRNERPVNGSGNPFDAKVHMARHRTGARGKSNAMPPSLGGHHREAEACGDGHGLRSSS